MWRISLGLTVLLLLAAPARAGGMEQVAVLRFLPREPDAEHEWVGTALADLLGGRLAARAGVIVVERERIGAVLRELDLADRGIADGAAAGRLARVAAADRAVFGTFAVAGGKIEAEAGFVDAATGRTVTTATATGSVEDLAAVAEALAAGLRGPPRDGTPAPVRLPATPALADYWRGLAASRRGDYPAAFVHLARAARASPPHPDAGTELGRLYLEMGEPEHALVAWRKVAAGADEDHAVDALLLVADTCEHVLDDLGAAAEVLAEIAERFPDRPDRARWEVRSARLRARAGDAAGALRTLAALADRLDEEAARIRAAIAKNPRDPSLSQRLPVLGSTAARTAWREIWIEAALAGESLEPRSVDCALLDPESPELRVDGATARWLVAPPGLAIDGARVEVEVGPPTTFSGEMTVRLGSPGVYRKEDERKLVAKPEARTETVELGAVAPSRVSLLFVTGPVKAWRAKIRLVPEAPAMPRGARPVVTGFPGVVQHARLSRDRDGRIHAVFSGGDPGWSIGRSGQAVGIRKRRADLFLATSTDGGETFGPSRRLPVSSAGHDLCPFLLSGRDGRHHLVWVSNRTEERIYQVWSSVSADLVDWSFPRPIPVPALPADRVGGEPLSETGFYPKLFEDSERRLHLFVAAPWAPEGMGVYEATSDDGREWSRFALVARGEFSAPFAAAIAPDGGAVVALRGDCHRTELFRSGGDRRWRRVPFPTPESREYLGIYQRPALALLPDGSVLVAETFNGGETVLTRFGPDGEAARPVVEPWILTPEDLLPVADGPPLFLFAPPVVGTTGSLFVAPLEMPR